MHTNPSVAAGGNFFFATQDYIYIYITPIFDPIFDTLIPCVTFKRKPFLSHATNGTLLIIREEMRDI